jgi:hypothetical protein
MKIAGFVFRSTGGSGQSNPFAKMVSLSEPCDTVIITVAMFEFSCPRP